MCKNTFYFLLLVCSVSFSQITTPDEPICTEYISSSYIVPSCIGTDDGQISLNLKNIKDGIYNNHFYYNDNSLFSNVVVTDGIAIISNLTEGVYNNVRYVNPNFYCGTLGNVDISLVRPYYFRPALSPIVIDIKLCHLDNPTVGDLPTNDQEIDWLLSLNSNTILNPTDLLKDNTTYYAKSKTPSDCNHYYYSELHVSLICNLNAQDDYAESSNLENGNNNLLNVLNNDVVSSHQATTENVSVSTSLTSQSSYFKITTDGTVIQEPNIPIGTYTLDYSICDLNSPTNCDKATVKIIIAEENTCPFSNEITTTNPSCKNNDGEIVIDIFGLEEGVYNNNFFYNENSAFNGVIVKNGKATISGLGAGEYQNIRYTSTTVECPDAIKEDVVLTATSSFLPAIEESATIRYTECSSSTTNSIDANSLIPIDIDENIEWFFTTNLSNPVNNPVLNQTGSITYYALISNTNIPCQPRVIVPVEITLLPESECSLSTSNIENNTFGLYPNPAVNELNIETDSTITSVEIYNVLGQLVVSNYNGDLTKINISAIARGTYIIHVNSNSKIITSKFIKK